MESMETTLLNAVAEIQTRRQVEEVIREMVMDIEVADHLEKECKYALSQKQWEQYYEEQDRALDEIRAQKKYETKLRQTLADQMVKELVNVVQVFHQLDEIQHKHSDLMLRYDEVVAKLMNTEQELEHFKSGTIDTTPKNSTSDPTALRSEDPSSQEFQVQTQAPAPSTTATSEQTMEAVGQEEESQKSAEDVMPGVAQQEDDKTVVVSNTGNQLAEQDATHKAELVSDNMALSTTEPAPLEDPAVVVVSLDDDVESDVPKLEELDTKILMQIFSYLDALDILNTAQVNISMYSRVDSLFGLGQADLDTAEELANGENELIQEPGSSHGVSQPANAAPSKSASSTSVTTGNRTGSQATSSAVTSNPTIAAIPPYPAPATQAPPDSGTVTTASTTPQRSGGSQQATSAGTYIESQARGLFSLLQPGGRKPVPAGSSSSAATSSGSATSAVSPSRRPDSASSAPPQQSQPMTAAMANSMASKLTDAELNAIIVMTERLKRNEALVSSLKRERDVLQAQLDGTEAVKQFLITKVRDMETALSKQDEDEMKVTLQIASDQEVIAFLDGRVQELESSIQKTEKSKMELQQRWEQYKIQTDQKVAVLSDMLQYERERLADQEREWKATKRLLVKEIKACHSQLHALQAERDGYREQNQSLLRKATVLS